MADETPSQAQNLNKVYFLTQIMGAKVTLHGKKIGRLEDVVIVENNPLPEVTHLYVVRSFGRPSLLIPLERVRLMSAQEIVVDLEKLEKYESEPGPEAVLLRDHVLDKKVLDMEDREVEVVYDVKMVLRNNKLYVSDVDLSRFGLLRRMHLKFLADWIYQPRKRVNRQIISWSYIQPLPSSLGRFRGDVKLNILKEKLADIYPVDLADILEELDRGQRAAIFEELDPSHASDILEEIDPNVQRELISSLSNEKAAALINLMTPGQAADIMMILSHHSANQILNLLDPDKTAKIKSIMEKQEATIYNFATVNFMKFPPDTTAGEIQDGFQKLAKDKDVVSYIYVTDQGDKLLGVIDLKELLQADDKALLKDIMIEKVISLHPTSNLREAYNKFARYNFRAIPLTDNNNKILGVVPYRDVMNLKHRFLE